MNEPTSNRHQGSWAAGDVGSTTGSAGHTPSGPPLGLSPAAGVPVTPADVSGPRQGHRRRLEMYLDGHFELSLYVSPRLLRWLSSGIVAVAAGATWYLNNH
ncbi:hypothetical protein CP973_07765 [Streptomyces albofaciens JCM 4342]|uniref:hypothetical protein n=1 Tax=Streptomyces albofaciens TaxID=66866 RepID=UPI00123B4420|nr:hypothetical protein [Streptomyces albofaciens]KAA6221869.1 hypothetical protein CP973_07765 [Streptomyces albofaciens JCM 4342]